MTGHLNRAAAAAAAAACALIAAGAGCSSPARGATAGQRCPPPVGGRIVDETGKPVIVTGKAAAELAPPGPDGGLVCRYEPPTPSGGLQLQRSAQLTAQTARQIAAQLRDLPNPQGGRVTNCPMSKYQYDTLVFTYPHRPAAYVNVGISGFPGVCDPVTNGVIYRPSTPALLGTLTALAGGPGKPAT